MTRNVTASVGAILFVLAGGSLGGCASTDHGGQARHSSPPGMMCPKCETVWVGPEIRGQGSKVQAYQWGREAVCPDCDAMAHAYFKDGEKVLHDCPTCKVKPRPAVPYTPTHPKGTHI